MNLYLPTILSLMTAQVHEEMKNRLVRGLVDHRMLAFVFAGEEMTHEILESRNCSNFEEEPGLWSRVQGMLRERQAEQAILALLGWTTYNFRNPNEDYCLDRDRTEIIIVIGANREEGISFEQPYARHPDGRVFFGQVFIRRGLNRIQAMFYDAELKQASEGLKS